ncbi:MAG: glycosyltransferase family protein [Candidatus Omnitrophica bacterium]|nr:glycosyltransferase family protein [Candidatus Omnitrophota bacterium]
MNIGAIVQARFASTRFPGKILKELPYASGVTVLQQVIRRLRRSKSLNEIIIATTTGNNENAIVEIAEKENVGSFRGSENDVLSRYYLAAKERGLDIVVRVTSDCPCIDPEIIDSMIKEHLSVEADYTSNSLDRTCPHGLDAEVFNFRALEKAQENAQKDYEREHVTPYISRKPSLFKIKAFKTPQGIYAPDVRITLDTKEDYALLLAVFDYLYPKNNYFTAHEIVTLFQEKPWLKLINKKIIQKKVFDTLEDELEEVNKILDLQELRRARDFIKGHLTK